MTKPGNEPTQELPTVPGVIVKHFRSDSQPTAVCQQCTWSQVQASLAEMRIHVRHHPTHEVIRTEATIVKVWAEDRNGVPWKGRENG